MDEKLHEYSLNEIEIGFKKNFEITITESMLNDFAKLSGDYNPLHMNEEYASSLNQPMEQIQHQHKWLA